MELHGMHLFISRHWLRWLITVYISLITCLYTSGAMAHDVNQHTKINEGSSESVQQFAVETLRIPDVPVIDTDYNTQGFVSRFADEGTIVISLTYTSCETLCPVSNIVLQQLDRSLVDMNMPSMKIVTLSIDPDNDTPDALRSSAKMLESSERWIWLTASAQHGRMLLDSLGVDTGAVEDHDPMFLVGNVTTGRFIRVIGMPDPDQLLALGRSDQL